MKIQHSHESFLAGIGTLAYACRGLTQHTAVLFSTIELIICNIVNRILSNNSFLCRSEFYQIILHKRETYCQKPVGAVFMEHGQRIYIMSLYIVTGSLYNVHYFMCHRIKCILLKKIVSKYVKTKGRGKYFI